MSNRKARRAQVAAVKAGIPGAGAARRRRARLEAERSLEDMREHAARVAEAEKRMEARRAEVAEWMAERAAKSTRSNSLLRLQMVVVALGGQS